MKIKIVKIKVQDADQEFDSSAFILGKHTVISTHAELKEEEDGLYWHAFFTYSDFEIASPQVRNVDDKKRLQKFYQDVLVYVKTHPTASTKAKNGVTKSIHHLPGMLSIDEFERFHNIGKGTVASNTLFFEGLLDIIYEYSLD